MSSQRAPTVQSDAVGVVIAGAGARGAYEAGVLSVLLPALAAEDAPPPILVGTSAGAINAALIAASAHLPPADAATALVGTWQSMGWRDVFRPPLLTAPRIVAGYLGEFAGLPWPRLTGLLDTGPLRRTAASAVDWGRLHDNVASGRVDTLATVATSASGRSAVFTEHGGDRSLPDEDVDRAIDYIASPIDPSHVLASAAIPIAFPAQHIEEPREWAGWYTDGGDRLNAPLKPALKLGAARLAIVATHPATYAAAGPSLAGEQPEIDDLAVQVMEAVLVDRMVEDVRALARVNELVDGHPDTARRVVPYAFFGPPTRMTLGELAEDVYDELFGGIAGRARAIRSPFPLLRRLLASTDGPRAGDLLSFLFFHPRFFDRAVELGREHARAALAEGSAVPWRTSPIRTTSGRTTSIRTTPSPATTAAAT